MRFIFQDDLARAGEKEKTYEAVKKKLEGEQKKMEAQKKQIEAERKIGEEGAGGRKGENVGE